jgi:hypothetical protein
LELFELVVISLYYFWQELMRLLQSHGIDFSFSWRSFAELYEEIYDKKQSRLQAFCARNAAPISFSYIIPESRPFSVMDGAPLDCNIAGHFMIFVQSECGHVAPCPSSIAHLSTKYAFSKEQRINQ